MVSGWLVWPGGLRLESTRDAGLASLTAAVLNRGTTRYDGDALAREIEGLAAVLDGFCGHNSLGLQTECLAVEAAGGIQVVDRNSEMEARDGGGGSRHELRIPFVRAAPEAGDGFRDGV